MTEENPEESDKIQEEAPRDTISRMSPEELRKFIIDFEGNKIFSTAHMQEFEMNKLGLVFMPIALGALTKYTEEALEDMGVIYEYYDKAGPRSINGLPCFCSMAIVHKEDWKIALKKVRDIIEAKNEALRDIDPNEDPEV